jgi:hypothetical protein
MHRSVRQCLRNTQPTALHKVDIPDTDQTADPKTWKGSWKTISAPNELASLVCTANAKQYHQAYDTPLVTEPMRSFIGINADTQGSENLLQGTMPPANFARNTSYPLQYQYHANEGPLQYKHSYHIVQGNLTL